MTVSDVIYGAFEDLATIQPGETLTSTILNDALNALNDVVGSLSAEGATNPYERHDSFSVIGGVTAYTMGVGGMFSTAARPVKLTSWKASSGYFTSGGKVLTIDELNTVAQAPVGETTVLPKAVGADVNAPLLNVRLYPTPAIGCTLELSYFVALATYAALTDSVDDLPPGWRLLLRKALAVDLYPRYARPGVALEALAGQLQSAKGVLVSLQAPQAPGAAQ